MLFSLLLLFGRVILEQFLHGLVEALLVLLLVRAGINGLSGVSCPDELFCRGVVHVQNESPDTDGRAAGRRHSTSPTKASAHAIGVPLLLLIDRDLIADIEVSLVV